MNSIQSHPEKRSKLASVGGHFYIRSFAPRRKKQPVVEENTKESVVKPPVRNYDEGYLFHLFCCVDGRMPDLFSLIRTLPPDQQVKIPQSSTLYKIAAEHDWRTRFEVLRSKIRENFEARNGLPYTKIDQLASYLLQGTMMRFVSALKEENYKEFSMKDLKAVWHMSRTERGLAPTVPYKDQNQERYKEQVLSIQEKLKNADSSVGQGFYERLDELTHEELKLIEYVMLGKDVSEDDDIPRMIRKE